MTSIKAIAQDSSPDDEYLASLERSVRMNRGAALVPKELEKDTGLVEQAGLQGLQLQLLFPLKAPRILRTSGPDPGLFTNQHTFENKYIYKATSRAQIDEAIAEGYDFYLNFRWGTTDDAIAGIEAIEYFESFNLPSAGLHSEERRRSKFDFFAKAKQRGVLHVEMAYSGKMLQLCEQGGWYNQLICERIVQFLARYDEKIDHVVCLSGLESLSVEELDFVLSRCFQLARVDYLTFEVKFHPETHVELLRYQDDPTLYTKLQELAVQAFHANKMAGRTWCNVDIRVPPPGQGEPVVLEVNPMPAVFLPLDHEWEDIAIRESFPGGHRALINMMIASHLLRRRAHEEKLNRVAEVYDNVSVKYDDTIAKLPQVSAIYRKILDLVDFSQGTILELGAGTGLFGRALAEEMQQRTTPPDSDSDSASSNNQTPSSSSSSLSPRPYSLTGIELSQGMAEKCRQTGVYEKIHHGAVQAILPTLGPFDHILSLSVLYFLPPVDFSLTMVRSFQLARKSLVVWIDEIPETYTAKLLEMGPPHSHMIGYNHLEDMEKTFCNSPPPRWKLAEKFRQSG
ncbi:uncharacterized protein NFIA_012550 [Aspergillus fischeri NRRL 181]|uniref:ATP-grasp domain-containing protein n=1 Tax=Neosartorya fischeri (strain ATCC 1020 / DSM 3700 / CBS 544.65 / FGSC A1164 / JCM 1740 / NRRL 181 / WB 181) TaxID=331117 RepID=A1D2C3_NEOFI|nr:uncharacterized protein NFIA_012550 [Aspergillus fischeri NRRL 181]EAW22566.1 predicted protein [Aspergillus fischeri NRRL 181]